MKYIFIYLLYILLLTSYRQIYAQEYEALDWEDILVQLLEDEENKDDYLTYIEELKNIYQHPVNINIITKKQLEVFPFLTDIQIENILYYRYIVDSFTTLYELQLVEDMDRETLHLLCSFVYLGPPKVKHKRQSLHQQFKYGKHEIRTRLDFCLNKKQGYSLKEEYLGNPIHHNLNYAFHYKDALEFGLVMEKDAGEPFFKGGNRKGYDYYSAYYLIRHHRRIETLALGNYRLRYGMGLVMNTYFGMGKTSSIATLGYRSSGIYKHSSTNEWNYLQGIALNYKLSTAFQWAIYYSHKRLDAIVDKDVITCLKRDGLHRTKNDFKKRNKAVLSTYGTNLSYHSTYFSGGINIVHNVLNKPLITGNRLYQHYALQGKHFTNISCSYRYRYQQFLFYGETAFNEEKKGATINALRFTPFSGYTLLLLYRNYHKGYTAWQSKSITEGGKVQNEEGYLVHLTGTPCRYLKFSVCADFFHFPWLTYNCNHPSSGFEIQTKLSYLPQNNLAMYLRYTYQDKDKTTKLLSINPSAFEQQKWQYQLGYVLHKTLAFRTTIAYSIVGFHRQHKEKGLILFQSFSCKLNKIPFSFHINYGLFDTDSYASAMHIYERGVLYALSIPTFSGKGMHFSTTFRYDITKKLLFMFKLGHTNYSDRDQIGVGGELIQGNTKTNVTLQIRVHL